MKKLLSQIIGMIPVLFVFILIIILVLIIISYFAKKRIFKWADSNNITVLKLKRDREYLVSVSKRVVYKIEAEDSSLKKMEGKVFVGSFNFGLLSDELIVVWDD